MSLPIVAVFIDKLVWPVDKIGGKSMASFAVHLPKTPKIEINLARFAQLSMKFLLVISLVCLACCLVSLVAGDRLDDVNWRAFKSRFNRVYANSSEEAMRRSIFLANKRRVEQHNRKAGASYKLGHSHLSDWTSDELARLNGIKQADLNRLAAGENEHEEARERKLPKFVRRMLEEEDDNLPRDVDWRGYGRVGPVVSQGFCASDWAFATTGLLEGQQVNLSPNRLVPLSAQDVMDCSPSGRDCDGGFMADALDDIAKTGGVESEHDYPYLGPKYHQAHHNCAFNKSKSVLTVKAGHVLPKSEPHLKRIVARYGPVAAAVHATHNFINYASGILADDTCVPGYLNHAVLVVGYGSIGEQDYWLVKNSWTQEWGEEGYARILRNKGQDCGLTAIATVAEL